MTVKDEQATDYLVCDPAWQNGDVIGVKDGAWVLLEDPRNIGPDLFDAPVRPAVAGEVVTRRVTEI